MTNKQIQSFINKLNANTYHKTIFKHQIGKDVDFAKVWESQKTKDTLPFRFFFIKKKSKYIGAVLDMCNDLHWYISPKYRGKGYLTKALNNTILPFVFEVLEREEQSISITKSQIGLKNYNSSSKVALSVGFKKTDDNKYVLYEEDFKAAFDTTNVLHKGLNNLEIEKLSQKLNTIAKQINQIDAQLESAFGYDVDYYSNTSLRKLSDKIASYKFILDDIVQDFTEKNS
ncbi:hypothetical protein [Winogradskyella sp.]|uniref:hypothetical protein n=1 Tax=Winogradskyella sp. TaxID=1883156 RepID=UPI003F6D232A